MSAQFEGHGATGHVVYAADVVDRQTLVDGSCRSARLRAVRSRPNHHLPQRRNDVLTGKSYYRKGAEQPVDVDGGLRQVNGDVRRDRQASVSRSSFSADPSLSLVVPFFNEMHRIDRTLSDIIGLARSDVEVVLVDDGSTDGTTDVLRTASSSAGVQFLGLSINRGKGAAVRAGVAKTSGTHVVFMDADLATDLNDLPRLRAALDDADIAIGSRSVATAELNEATLVRSWMGGFFNRVVRATTGLDLLDTQCGFKAFRGDVARSLFAQSQVDGFAFDVEILMLARQSGMRIVEVPVRWTEVRGSRVRFAVDPLTMLYDLIRIRRRTTRAAGPASDDLSWSNPVSSDEPTPPIAPHPTAHPAS